MRGACRIGICIVGLGVLVGCPPRSSTPGNGGAPGVQPPTAAQLVTAHNRRIEHLDTLYARGVVELEWVDNAGRTHNEPQVDLEVWIDRPRHTAFRIDKFGEVYLWAGSDTDRFWLFDLTGEQRQLTVGLHASAEEASITSIFGIEPLLLLDLMALTPLSESNVIGAVTRDADRNAWLLDVSRQGAALRLGYADGSFRPIFVSLIDGDGQTVLWATLERYESVRLADLSIDPPQIAEVMRIRDEAGQGRMEIFFDEVTDGQVDAQPFDRVFDLDRLCRALRPDVVNDHTAGHPGG